MRLLFVPVLVLLMQSLTAQVLPASPFQLVNSSLDEQNPVISPDGQTLYFTISNHPDNIGGKKDPGDIWFSRWTGDQWSAPIHAGMVLNNRAYNAVAGISSNGNGLFLHGHYDATGNNAARTQGISLSGNSGNGWSRPANIHIPYFQNKSGILSGTVTGDGTVFIFSAETYGTHGVDDLYACTIVNGKWSEPKNLGPVINTQFQEVSPSISADGLTLYFSSNGRKGRGSFDVYVTTRLDDGWTNWSTPVNMGDNINSSGRELYFRPQAELGLAVFTTTINSDGYGDIRMYKPDQPFPKPDSIVAVAEPEIKPDTVRIIEVRRDSLATPKEVNVYGKVVNSKTGEPINAEIIFSGHGLNKTTRSSSGGYAISVLATEEYSITIEAQGFVSTMEKLDIDTYEMQELEMNFSLQPVEVGTTVNLKNVLFAQAKTEILPESFPELNLVVHFLQTNPNVRIDLSGHTDNRGVHADNVKLSQQRVNKVKEYLVQKGIESKRISGKGYGGTKPIASNDTEESRRMNRRVEFTIKRF
jgi:outer membrane protein OmpA-like peptidoglycan-associated protein